MEKPGRGGSDPKTRPKETPPLRSFTPSGRGRKMEVTGQEGRERTPGPSTTSTPRGAEGGTTAERGACRGRPRPRREGIRCFHCGEERHVRRECGSRLTPRDTAWTQTQVQRPSIQTMRVLVNTRPGIALIDSGCTQTLAKRGWVRPEPRGGEVRIRCVHGDICTYPTGRASLEIKGERLLMRVGIAPNLPMTLY